MEVLKRTTIEQQKGLWVSKALVQIKDDKHFAEDNESGITIDSITGVGRTKDEAEAQLDTLLAKKGMRQIGNIP